MMIWMPDPQTIIRLFDREFAALRRAAACLAAAQNQ